MCVPYSHVRTEYQVKLIGQFKTNEKIFFSHWDIKLWNSISEAVKDAESWHRFKSEPNKFMEGESIQSY